MIVSLSCLPFFYRFYFLILYMIGNKIKVALITASPRDNMCYLGRGVPASFALHGLYSFSLQVSILPLSLVVSISFCHRHPPPMFLLKAERNSPWLSLVHATCVSPSQGQQLVNRVISVP